MEEKKVEEKESDIVYRVQFFNEYGEVIVTHHYAHPSKDWVVAEAYKLMIEYYSCLWFEVSYNKKGEKGWKII